MKKTLSILLLILVSFLIVGCKKPTDPKITNILITEDSINEFDEGKIDLSLIKIKVILDNGKVEIKDLKEEYLETDINNVHITDCRKK